MIYAYIRVSTNKQDYELQKNEILEYCKKNKINLADKCIFLEKITGKNTEREKFKILMQQVKPGDAIVLYKLDRLGRNLSDMILTHDKLLKKGIGIISITDNLDTRDKDDTTTKIIVTFLSLFADIERTYILERTHAGRLQYVANGGKLGRKPKLNSYKIELIKELLDAGKTKKEIADFLGVDRTTIYRNLNRN